MIYICEIRKYKILDMEKFKCQIDMETLNKQINTPALQKLSENIWLSLAQSLPHQVAKAGAIVTWPDRLRPVRKAEAVAKSLQRAVIPFIYIYIPLGLFS